MHGTSSSGHVFEPIESEVGSLERAREGAIGLVALRGTRCGSNSRREPTSGPRLVGNGAAVTMRPMPTFVALLRGVNVGKAKRVPMAELRALLAELGYTGVRTLLNSGNAVFRASSGTPGKHAEKIAAAIANQFKIEVPVIVKSANELATIVSGNPIKAGPSEHPRLLVAFVQDEKGLSTLAAIGPLVVSPERFALGNSAGYLLCANGFMESKAAVALLGKAGNSATTRNWATVLKLQALAAGDG